jgi:hypothetical protein
MHPQEFSLTSVPDSAEAAMCRYPMRYVPVPPNGKVCPVTGLKHAYLYRLLRHGEAAKHVRIAHLKEPGCSRGRVLFHAGDMLRWLDQLAMAGRTQGGQRGAARDVVKGQSASGEGAATP